jgi:cytochrome P450
MLILSQAVDVALLTRVPRPRRRTRLTSALLTPLPRPVDDAIAGVVDRWPVTDLAEAPADCEPVPGSAGLQVVGHCLDYVRYGSDFLRSRTERLGPVWWMGGPSERVVVITGAAATQEALTVKAKSLSQDGWDFMIGSFFRRGLMLMSFDEHKLHRRIMQEAFTRDRLTTYVAQLAPAVECAVGAWPTGRLTPVYPLLKTLTLDVASDVFMGGRGGREDTDRLNEAFVATVRAGSSPIRHPLPGTRWRAGLRGRAVLEEYFTRHLPAARRGEGDDLFAALCRARTPDGEAFTDRDVIDHMIFLMMAAHDTSTITTAAAAYFLATHPQWQERARAESDRLGASTPTLDDLEQLETLDLVVKETLRLVAPVPVLMRRAVDDVEIAGRWIPAGTLVSVCPGVNHFDPECWTEPDCFDPERFTDSRREDKNHRFAWLPFGGGAHKCIGMHFGSLEVKAILHRMLRTYTWTVPEGYQARWDNTSLPVPADGLPITLRRR